MSDPSTIPFNSPVAISNAREKREGQLPTCAERPGCYRGTKGSLITPEVGGPWSFPSTDPGGSQESRSRSQIRKLFDDAGKAAITCSQTSNVLVACCLHAIILCKLVVLSMMTMLLSAVTGFHSRALEISGELRTIVGYNLLECW